MKGLQPEVLEQISRWPSAHAHGDEACTHLIAYTDGSACMTRAWPRLAAELSGEPWTRQEYGGWLPVETDPAAQLFLGASRPTSPVGYRHRERAEDATVDHSLSDSQYALGVVLGEDRALSEIPLVQLARSEARCHRHRAGIEGRHVAGGCWPQAVDGTRAGRCAHFLRTVVSSRVRGTFLYAGRSDILAGNQGRGRSVKAFSAWQTVSRGCGAYLRVRQCPHAASRRAQCCFSNWSSCHDRAARRSR